MPELEERPFPGLVYRREQGEDIIVWNNRVLPVDRRLLFAYLGALIPLVPLALFLTVRLVTDVFLPQPVSAITPGRLFAITIVLFCWVAVGAILYTLLRLTWTETIAVRERDIQLTYSGLLAFRQKQIPADSVWRLSFERYVHRSDREARYSVNIIHRRRDHIAYWMRPEEARHLFILLGRIFRARGWNVDIRDQ